MTDDPQINVRPAPPARSPYGRIGLVLLYLVGAFVVSNICALAGYAVGRALGFGPDHLSRTSSAAGLLVLGGAGEAGYAVWTLASARLVGGVRTLGLHWRGTLRAFALALPVLAFSVILPVLAELSSHDHGFHGGRFLVAAAVTVCCIGFGEEVLFRGGVIELLRPGRSHRELTGRDEWFVVLVSGVLFGLVHVLAGGMHLSVFANAGAVALLVGVPFAMIRLRGGSIWGLAAAHAVNDFYALARLGSADVSKLHTSAAAVVAQLGVSVAIACGYSIWFVHSRGRNPLASSE